MPHYRRRFSRRYFTHFDLPEGEGDLTVTIVKVETGTLKNEKDVEEQKPFLTFDGHSKPLGCNATNGLTIAALYGDDDDQWVGKRITLYRSNTMYGGRLVDCIRVRPSIPAAASPPAPAAPPAPGRRSRKAA